MEEVKEVPKRKRRTKAEIEADKSQVEIKQELMPEQSVIIMACLNPNLASQVTSAAQKEGVEVVILEDRIIHDYLHTKKNSKMPDIGEFLNNASNRLHAEDQAVKLWMLLTGGQPIEESEGVIFTRTDVVKKTNLTHSKADQIFQLLRAFGMIEFVKGIHEFTMHFDKKRWHKTIETEIVSICKSVNNDILRYKASLNADESLSVEAKNKMREDLKKAIDEAIIF